MNNNIFPCLWFNGNGEKAAKFYCKTFGGSISADSGVVINIELFSQKMMLLNAGPQFEKNASISFMVLCESEEEIQRYWESFSEGGLVLMELAEYPWSKKYGWIRDQFGVTWQFNLGDGPIEQKIIPTLMFINKNNGKAQKAMDFYTSVFPHSKIGSALKYGEGVGNKQDEVSENIQHADFAIDGYHFFCMDNSHKHQFDFNEGISIVVMTDNQKETDHLWNALIANGGRESMCGWLKDQFGVSWQIVPKRLLELMNDFDNPQKAQKVVQSMMTMQKIEISELERAYQS
ncbi:VOC family protein [Chryseobacterium sp. SNU WT5]|uniref:VOC family protein n=1 Tax=Chryseobacterium sp. SNU WT5 TaxID=2594269 RepID=UPI00117E9FD1|nr:VOC family protein [Chryseobacterium sp. SNU WT5]QDP84286.1 VOC family protein [Chryseobacterium sp. SNU WT5]